MTSTLTTAACHKYELEIAIEAPRADVWRAIFEQTEQWWLPDFHVAGSDSVVSFDPQPGGTGLIEKTPDGGGLQWYSVQMYLPTDFKIYLVGHIAPEWGGPTVSCLRLSVLESDSGSILQVSDARHGNIDEAHQQSYQEGWQQLFTSGLKAFIESAN